MAYTETLFIYKDTYLLCKLLLKYSKNVSLIAYRTSYNIRRRTWYMMPHKEMVYCVNMKKIKIKNKYKLKK